jgi:membrane fusion protein (multidrug efflux system)
MKVQFTISEKQMTEGIRAGLRAKGKKQQQFIVKVVLPDGTLYSKHGVIKFIDNRVNPLTGTIKLRAVFPNPDDLLIPGQYLKVSVEREKTHKALLVPRAAIQQDQSGKYVMLVDKDNKVAIRHIKTKGDFGINTVVEEGLKKGEKVITLGLQKVRPGIRVAPVIDKPYKGAAAPAEKSGKKDGSRKERK